MEPLLETAAERRQLVLDRLRGSAAQPVVDTTHEIAEKDMKDMKDKRGREISFSALWSASVRSCTLFSYFFVQLLETLSK